MKAGIYPGGALVDETRKRMKLIELEWQPDCNYVEPGLRPVRRRPLGPGPSGSGAQGSRKMQLLLLVGSIVLSVGAALGTASLFLSLLLRIMSKLR